MKPTVLLRALAVWAGCTLVSVGLQWRPATYLDLDEVYWIGSSYYFDLFAHGRWTHPHWQLLPARENPPVAKYVLGLGLAAAGRPVTTIDPLAYFHARWAQDQPALNTPDRLRVAAAATPGVLDEFHAQGRIPLDRPAVRAARTTVMLCAVLASLVLFALGTGAVNWVAGLIASQLLLLHPIVVSAYNQAMADAVALLFTGAAALVLYRWFRRFSAEPPPRHALGRSAAVGALLALACGAKMNSLVLVGYAGLLVALVAGRAWTAGDRRRAGRTVLHGLAILATGLAVFALINPTILQDPLGGFAATVLEHRHTEGVQASFLGSHLVAPMEKLRAVVALAGLGWIPFGALLALAVWGAVRPGSRPGLRFAAGWWLTALVGVTAWIPFPWPRYALPLVPPSALLLGCAIALLLPARLKVRLNCPA